MHSYSWGNAVYVNFSVNDSYIFMGKTVKLMSLENNYCTIRVENVEKQLIVARRSLPIVLEGMRIFIADNKNVKQISTDPECHGLLKYDALVCLSDSSRPLLDPNRYTFPISRRDGYEWHMEESSHMFAYYGYIPHMPGVYYRSHEGIDFNLHDARGIEKHPLVAIENGFVRWVTNTSPDEYCILVESESQPGIYYVYQHVHIEHYYVKQGQHVRKGDILAYIWGDQKWGHLHFSVVRRDTEPGYEDRYDNLFNVFPQMVELWNEDSLFRPKIWRNGEFTFGRHRQETENKKRDSAYDDIVGYGWRLGTWCTAGAVEKYLDKDEPRNLRLRKILHHGFPAECVNPYHFFDFEITVENGNYAVKAEVGDQKAESWQRISFNHEDAGAYHLDPNRFVWTPEKVVAVNDDKLFVRLELRDELTYAGISQLHFKKL